MAAIAQEIVTDNGMQKEITIIPKRYERDGTKSLMLLLFHFLHSCSSSAIFVGNFRLSQFILDELSLLTKILAVALSLSFLFFFVIYIFIIISNIIIFCSSDIRSSDRSISNSISSSSYYCIKQDVFFYGLIYDINF